MQKLSPKILLFNPWIYDFAAYDFWVKPLGLLHIAGMLRHKGYETFLIDCLDRHHPVLLKYLGLAQAPIKGDGTGKFLREKIEKPAAYSSIPRQFCRYGMPPVVVEKLLDSMPFEPDYVFVTSIMTYWYPAVFDAVKKLRKKFLNTKIVLGGIYASLCPEHATDMIQPDFLVLGEGESKVMGLLNGTFQNLKKGFEEIVESPNADYSQYENLESAAILTSRGCPFNCSFCASKQLVSSFFRKSPQSVFKEIESLVYGKNIKHVAFYDDALLYDSGQYFKPLLRKIIDSKMPIQMHMPNGLQIRYIDEEMAGLFYKANVKTIRLSFESSDKARQKKMYSKVKNADLEKALYNLEAAGFDRNDIAVYLLMGLPDQGILEFKESVNFVNNLGAKVSVASFSPIPGTVDWQNSIDSGFWKAGNDLLLTNNSIFPIWSKKYSYTVCTELMQWAKQKNESLN